MGPSEKSYNISQIGSWPYESYQITPDATKIDPRYGYLYFVNNFPVYNNIGINLKKTLSYNFGAIPIDYTTSLYQIDLSNGDSFNFSNSAARLAFKGYSFNNFYINIDPMSFGYVLYPTRIFLKPTSVSKTVGGWRLKTSAILLSATPLYYQSTDPTLSAHEINKAYYSNYSDKIEMAITPLSTVSLFYSICASEKYNNRKLIEFTDTYNPYEVNMILEPSYVKIKEDSTHLYYKHTYLRDESIPTPSSESVYYNLDDPFLTSYIFTPITQTTTQTFLMLQSAIDFNYDFSTVNNCILTSVLDIATSNFKYYSITTYIDFLTQIALISGVPGTSLGLRYVSDSTIIKNTNQSVNSTVTYTNNAGTSLYQACSSNQVGFDNVTWDLIYPPHYYNFNIGFSDKTTYKNVISQDGYLTFKLSAHSINASTSSVTLSTYIYSDFQILKLDLPTYGIYDYIKFDITTNLDLFLSSICCYYGVTELPYYALSPQWIPAVSANLFKITSTTLDYGELTYNVFPTLSTLAGYIEPTFSTTVKFNEGAAPIGSNGNPIFLTTLDEGSDYIEASVSLLTSESAYPTRDLQNSYISWYWTPPTVDAFITSLSSYNGTPQISSIYAGQRLLFSPESWTVILSGYGPNSISLAVSSEKYNETAFVATESSYFQLFEENSFIIGSYTGLNNLDYTRTITLTAGVPYKNRVYPLPNNLPIFWDWTYDDSTDFIPVTAYNSSITYNPATTIISNTGSAIDLSIEPPINAVLALPHTIGVSIYGIANNTSISAHYNFEVDEFPALSIFDANFNTYYKNLTSEYIASTKISDVLTRPLDSKAQFTFIADPTILNNRPDTTLYWKFEDNLLALSSLSGTSTVNYNVTGARMTTVTLSALNSIALGWTSAHNVAKTLTIYTLPSAEFNAPLKFNIYPEFYWESGRNLTISDTSNYTNSLAPTAYLNTNSDTYNFWVSSNKQNNFNQYIYSIGDIQTSGIALLEIPYNSSLESSTGLSISLTAFGTEFPETNGLYYKVSSTSGLITNTFNITSISLPYNSSVTSDTNFQRSPKLIPYSSSNFTFSANVTSIDVANNRYISITQSISSDPSESPVQPNGGTITYTLSSEYWTTQKSVSAINGTNNVFSLFIGDPFIPLNVSNKSLNTLYLTASASINKTIPETTFSNYPTYTGDKNLWKTLSESLTSSQVDTLLAYTTATNFNLFISDYYSLTGESLSVSIDNFYSSDSNPIISYFVDYGDDVSEVLNIGEVLYHSYSSEGLYVVNLSSIYLNGDIQTFSSIKPIRIYQEWPVYDQGDIRFLSETTLVLPYTQEQVDIQPNEFGNIDIYNTAIGRLYQNLDYLISNTRTINTDSPTDVFGWLGSNSYAQSDGIRWHTPDYNSEYFNSYGNAASTGRNYFTDIKTFAQKNNNTIVLDNGIIKYFLAGKIPTQVTFSNYTDFATNFLGINHFDSNDAGDVLYVSDSINNKVHRVDLEISDISYIFDILDIGGFGDVNDPNKFNSPEKIVYMDSYIYVLDYNNNCIKKYTEQLTWVYTYYSESFVSNNIQSFDVHPTTGLVYSLNADYVLYIFDTDQAEFFTSLDIGNVVDRNGVLDFRFDEAGEFFYVLTATSVYKFSTSGIYIGLLNIPSGMQALRSGSNHSISVSSPNYILKTTDIVEMFGIGDGLSKTAWSQAQVEMGSDEFASNDNYNRSLQRIVQNIKKFRDTLDSKYVITTENTYAGNITYFAKKPITISERPMFSTDVENENVKIGVNELHIPQVFNREFTKVYSALETLKAFLDIESVSTTSDTTGVFCWSWKAMSCYNLTLPIIKISNINPITFAELKSNFPVNYAPTKNWGNAQSACCNGLKSPLM